jgi:crossover junction endodeoxyribonuclease RuvC
MMRERSTNPPALDSSLAKSTTAQAVLGVDPGLGGGIAILLPDDTVTLYPVPVLKAGTSKREYDVPAMMAILSQHQVALAIIESVAARPGQGVSSMFKFGLGLGLWQGLLSGLGIPFHLVRPQDWKKAILCGTKKDKVAAIMYAQRRWPTASLLRSPRSKFLDHGLAEAACLAEWGRRLLAGGLVKNPEVPSHAPATTPGLNHQGPSAPARR